MTPNASRDAKDAGPNRASWIPAYSLLLSTTFHASVFFALLWVPLTERSAVEDAIQLTIERPIVPPASTMEAPAPIPEQPAPQMEAAAQAPTAENAIAEPEPAPEVSQRDFPKPEPVAKMEPVVPRIEQKKPSAQPDPKPVPKPDVNKALAPPPGDKPSAASSPAPPPDKWDVDPTKINERAARLWGTRYFERMGIKPSHQATLTGKSGRACPLDPQPYKLELVNNKLTVTNDYGVMFSATVPASGEIDEIYKRPPMAGDHATDNKNTWMKYRMLGNVKSGKLEIWYLGCVYTLSLL